MDPFQDAQDVIRCHLCETPVPPMHCDICNLSLCKLCVGEHISDESKEHKVVSFQKRGTTPIYPKCSEHFTQCELHCEQCDIPICVHCVSSKTHHAHYVVHILKSFESKKELLQRDLQELKNCIHPRYCEIASSIQTQKADLNENSQKLTAALHKQGEIWHKEVDNIIMKLKANLGKIDSKHMDELNKVENEITYNISDITQIIGDLKKVLDSNDASLVFTYKSKNSEFRKLPRNLIISLPRFIPQKINKNQIYQQFGSLSELSIKTEERGYIMDSGGYVASPIDNPLISEPKVIKEVYENTDEHQVTFGVSCKNDTRFWLCQNSKYMSLYNVKGNALKSIATKSGNDPWDIAVTTGGDLVYTDYNDRSVDLVKNSQIHTLIKLRGWIPHNICSTSSGDLLVIVESDDYIQTKVVRYSGSREKTSIQFDDFGQPLYSTGVTKYITENRNQDICVTDFDINAVVVVNQAGKLRFTYTGPSSTTIESFYPYGITTDSQCRILIADHYPNNLIHILNKDGQFLRFISNCKVWIPRDLCVDSKDNLFVTDCFSVKKIQYFKFLHLPKTKYQIQKKNRKLRKELVIVRRQYRENVYKVVESFKRQCNETKYDITPSYGKLKELIKSSTSDEVLEGCRVPEHKHSVLNKNIYCYVTEMHKAEIAAENEELKHYIQCYDHMFERAHRKLSNLRQEYEESKQYLPPKRYPLLKEMVKAVIRDKKLMPDGFDNKASIE